IAEDAGGHRRQRLGQRDAALGDEAAQGAERPVSGRGKGVGIALWPAVDLGAPVVDAEDQVGLKADDRISSAYFAAFDRFEQKALRPRAGKLEEGGDRRLQVS